VKNIVVLQFSESNNNDFWTIPKVLKKRYKKLFNEVCEDGFANGSTAYTLFTKSGLDRQTLAKIWDLCDFNKEGRLNRQQFLMASHLISNVLQGNPIPDSVPRNLLGQRGINKSQSLRKFAKGFREMIEIAKEDAPNPTLTLEEDLQDVAKLDTEEIMRDKCIGKGTFAVVYKGSYQGAAVAIKDMLSPSRNEIEMWKKEVKLMAYLKSQQFLVQFVGYSYDDEKFTIVMEYMDQGSLYDIIHNKKVKWSMLKKVRILRHIAKALKSIHDVKLLHRDMKSMNVLVNSKGIAKLSDWGCSRSVALEEMTQGVGSPLWMAPEVLRTCTYSYPSDIYGFGIIIYEVLNESLPSYDKKKKRATIPNVCVGKQLIDITTDDNPDERKSAQELVEIFDRIIMKYIQSTSKEVINSQENNHYLPPLEDTTAWYNMLLGYEKEKFDSLLIKGLKNDSNLGFSE